ncbi:Protein MAIN-LIKE 1 [Glycine max]|nr:Protein MAIN-LIKE 1 [Glycine max]
MAPAAVEDIVADIPADTGAEAVEDEHEGFPGGPSDPSVLTQYADHVACSVWMREERPELKLSSHGRKVHSLGRPVPAIEGLIANIDDWGLLSSFVERWHRETSSFHLLVGELTIMLDDVSLLLHLPVIGDLHAFEPLHVDDAVQMLVDLLMSLSGLRQPSVVDRTYACNGYVIYMSANARQVIGQLRLMHMFFIFWVALCLLTRVQPMCMLSTWRPFYDREVRLRSGCSGAYVRPAERCIYEPQPTAWQLHHTAVVADSTADQDYDEDSPCACRWIAKKKTVKSIRTPAYRECLDRLWIPDVCWIPYREHRSVQDFHIRSCYFDRVVRQFGYRQTIPAPPIDSWVSYDDINDRWMHYSDHIIPAGEVCAVPGQCASDYMNWFFRISHPFMTLGHASDPLPNGHAPQPRVTDISHVPEPGASSTSVEEPRHAVKVCDDIAERLERHLSLGVVTPGSSTHEVIEECLRLARSVTQDHLVYVRSRRRRRTDHA